MEPRTRVGPADRRGLADEVADRIREAIFDGAYAPGDPLREVELSGTLQVSRGPVREALRVLEHEGLVHCQWHRGSTVTTLTPDDVAELASLRTALEDLAVTRVITHSGDDDLAAIERAAALMDGARDEHEMVRCDIAFHDAVFAAARHGRLRDAWEALRCQVHLFLLTRIASSTDGYLAGVRDEHQALVTALRKRDLASSLALFSAHRRHAVDVVVGAASGPDPALNGASIRPRPSRPDVGVDTGSTSTAGDQPLEQPWHQRDDGGEHAAAAAHVHLPRL